MMDTDAVGQDAAFLDDLVSNLSARPKLEVTSAAGMADWLRVAVGTGPLAGMFARGEQIVHTPREGEEGYVPLSDKGDEHDGPAQVRAVTADYLTARIQYSFNCVRIKTDTTGQRVESPVMFPGIAARTAINAVDMLPNLRRLAGVVHTPVVRPDGSLLAEPGYDTETRLLYLPEPDLKIPPVPDSPSVADIRAALTLLSEMVAGFPFVTEHDRANYYGLLLTPLLRILAPPPYKLGAIEAHQPGSGKTLLANLVRLLYGGVFRCEMPEEDAELRKQITSILVATTGPVVLLDNLSGTLKSSTLAGLLTSDRWDDRPLGSTAWARCTNDRLWLATANNLALGGDLPRRTLICAIDPGQPHPELRTGFSIKDLESWVRHRRGDLLAALLTLVRAWVLAGQPTATERSSDGYARWVRTVDGILSHAGIPGTFDDPGTQKELGSDDDDWRDFLHAVYGVFGGDPWSVRALLGKIDSSGFGTSPIPHDVLPGELADRAARAAGGVQVISKSLGRWLANREGRWAGTFTVRQVGQDRHARSRLWRIETHA